MVQVPGHVPAEGSINDVFLVWSLANAEHITTKMELFLPEISYWLADYFSNVLNDNCIPL